MQIFTCNTRLAISNCLYSLTELNSFGSNSIFVLNKLLIYINY